MSLNITNIAKRSKTGRDWREISASIPSCQAKIVVGRDGWDKDTARAYGISTGPATRDLSDGKHVKISMNGTLRLTWDEWAALVEQIDLAMR